MKTLVLMVLLATGAAAQGIMFDRLDPRIPAPNQIRIGQRELVTWCTNQTTLPSCLLYIFASTTVSSYKIPGTNLMFNLIPAFPFYATPMRSVGLWEPFPYFWDVPNAPTLLGHTMHVQGIALDTPTRTKIVATSNYLTMTFVRP